ncbi:hypothetical protein [Phosphitispora fastidiosa]|uniref:hypothetical protein n=1 Tax=Phosphitispora fastidiosa TaxID=2837202 RepID=UPI001E2CB12B|nr:hypothetical protein [Phosphitispora fastidiosa]MBU7006508.1 hypothetical protein [Phosphitispora fastidiosa]
MAEPFSDPLLATYTGPNGIEILSYHPQWTEQEKLKTVDVPAGFWAESSIRPLVEKGILQGYADGFEQGCVSWAAGQAAILICCWSAKFSKKVNNL